MANLFPDRSWWHNHVKLYLIVLLITVLVYLFAGGMIAAFWEGS